MALHNTIQRPSRNRGSIIVLTLWAVVFLALLAVAVASNVMGHLRVASDLKWSFLARAVGMRGLAEASTVVKNDATATYDSLSDSWASDDSHFKDVPFGEGTFSIVSGEGDPGSDSREKHYGLSDEERKISLNAASPKVLSFLLREAGMTSVRADELASFIVDWRDTNTTAEGSMGPEACASLSVPLICKNTPFVALEELWWMPGMTASVYDAIKGELTLYGSGQLNINTASPLALRALGLTASGAERIVQWRSSAGHFFENPGAIISRSAETGISEEDKAKLGIAVGAGFVGAHSDYFRGVVEANFGGNVRKAASFVINRKGEIQWWRE